MSAQEWGVAVIGLATVAYLGWRAVRRRLSSTCCGERECPAAKSVASRLAAVRESGGSEQP